MTQGVSGSIPGWSMNFTLKKKVKEESICKFKIFLSYFFLFILIQPPKGMILLLL